MTLFTGIPDLALFGAMTDKCAAVRPDSATVPHSAGEGSAGTGGHAGSKEVVERVEVSSQETTLSNPKRILVTLLSLAAVNVLLAFIVRGYLMWSGLVLILVFLGVFTSFIGAVDSFISFFVSKTADDKAGRRVFLLGAGMVSTICSLPLGWMINQGDIPEAKRYCEGLIPKLESYREQHGKYPEQITELGDLGFRPWLIWWEREFYRVDLDGYEFVFDDPSSLLCRWSYSSSTKEWHEQD